MATRNERRAKKRKLCKERSERIASAAKAYDVALTVKRNARAPKQRDYRMYGPNVWEALGAVHRGKVFGEGPINAAKLGLRKWEQGAGLKPEQLKK